MQKTQPSNLELRADKHTMLLSNRQGQQEILERGMKNYGGYGVTRESGRGRTRAESFSKRFLLIQIFSATMFSTLVIFCLAVCFVRISTIYCMII